LKKTLIVGTVAFDEIETPKESSGKILGGAATSMWLMLLKCSYILMALDPDPDAKMMIFLFILSNLYSILP
jgi:hypothetical protein